MPNNPGSAGYLCVPAGSGRFYNGRFSCSSRGPRAYGTGALLTDGRGVAVGGIGLTAAGSPRFFQLGEIYTPSDVAQAQGLQNLITDLPDSAFKKYPANRNYLKDKA